MHLLNRSPRLVNCLERCRLNSFLPQLQFYATVQPPKRPCNNWPEWQQPKGHDTGIKVYNALIKAKVPLITRHPGVLTWYVCGPTVYDTCHIGHGVTYLRFDVIRRILEDYFKLDLMQVTGITDVDEKIIDRANYFNVDIQSLTRYYESEFVRDMNALGVKPPHLYTRVTDYIPHIVQFVQHILDAGFAYTTLDGSVFFNNVAYRKSRGLQLPEEFDESSDDPMRNDIKRDNPLTINDATVRDSNVTRQQDSKRLMNNIGNSAQEQLQMMSDDVLKASQSHLTEPSCDGKLHSIDFVLWRSSKEGEPSWSSPFGDGRPGWHIECSAMASAVFGNQLDVHSGGIDLKFPHHYCEEAQSCARHGASIWTNYWWHSGHLTIDREKMSKSVGNVISIPDFLKTHSPNTFRQYILGTHYTRPIIYRDSTLQIASIQVSKVQGMLDACYHFITNNTTCRTQAVAASSRHTFTHPLLQELLNTKEAVDLCLRDDFNTAGAIQHLMRLVSLTNVYLKMNSTSASDYPSSSGILNADHNLGNDEVEHLENEHADVSSSECVNSDVVHNEEHLLDHRADPGVVSQRISGGELRFEEGESTYMNHVQQYQQHKTRSFSGAGGSVTVSTSNKESGIASSFRSNVNDCTGEVNVNTSESASSDHLVPAGRYEVTLVRNYILDIMQVFGMNYNTRQMMYSGAAATDVASDVAGAKTADLDTKFPDIMKSLLSFRQNVRDFALLKNITKEELGALSKAEKQGLRRDRASLLEACDVLRDQLAASSILVKDHKEGASWTISEAISAAKQESDETSKKC
uniref:cysteine--tRNA ligase n=2 Tax=Hirondellea gigas TaxID=1518452 RepID=A0A6A7FRW8_9CRUS